MSVPGMAVGKTGLERRLDEKIIGEVGFQRYEVNAFGKRIKQIKVDPGKAGQNFKTTLDLEVQKYVTEILGDTAAAVCVMDIYNGDIVSMVSSPPSPPPSPPPPGRRASAAGNALALEAAMQEAKALSTAVFQA